MAEFSTLWYGYLTQTFIASKCVLKPKARVDSCNLTCSPKEKRKKSRNIEGKKASLFLTNGPSFVYDTRTWEDECDYTVTTRTYLLFTITLSSSNTRLLRIHTQSDMFLTCFVPIGPSLQY